jgi:hypothetical protein
MLGVFDMLNPLCCRWSVAPRTIGGRKNFTIIAPFLAVATMRVKVNPRSSAWLGQTVRHAATSPVAAPNRAASNADNQLGCAIARVCAFLEGGGKPGERLSAAV